MSDVFQLESTIDSKEAADQLATALVEQRLAACVQVIGPIASTFRWQGQVERAAEYLFLCKVSEETLESAIAAIAQMHPYDVPEILAFKVDAGSKPYLDWVAEETSEPA